MHRTLSDNRRQALCKTARDLSRDACALQKAARSPSVLQEVQRLQGVAEAAQKEAEPLKIQARLEAGGSDRVANGEGQAEPEGLQDLHLLDGLLA